MEILTIAINFTSVTITRLSLRAHHALHSEKVLRNCSSLHSAVRVTCINLRGRSAMHNFAAIRWSVPINVTSEPELIQKCCIHCPFDYQRCKSCNESLADLYILVACLPNGFQCFDIPSWTFILQWQYRLTLYMTLYVYRWYGGYVCYSIDSNSNIQKNLNI